LKKQRSTCNSPAGISAPPVRAPPEPRIS
jgi:hypothetical protein